MGRRGKIHLQQWGNIRFIVRAHIVNGEGVEHILYWTFFNTVLTVFVGQGHLLHLLI